MPFPKLKPTMSFMFSAPLLRTVRAVINFVSIQVHVLYLGKRASEEIKLHLIPCPLLLACLWANLLVGPSAWWGAVLSEPCRLVGLERRCSSSARPTSVMGTPSNVEFGGSGQHAIQHLFAFRY